MTNTQIIITNVIAILVALTGGGAAYTKKSNRFQSQLDASNELFKHILNEVEVLHGRIHKVVAPTKPAVKPAAPVAKKAPAKKVVKKAPVKKNPSPRSRKIVE